MTEVFLGENLDLTHLIPQSRELALLSQYERITKINSDRWIGYARAQEAISQLEFLFNYPKRTRMPNMLVIGPTNNGKSMIIERFKRMHPPIHKENELISSIPLLVVQMPSDPTISRFYAMLLYSMNAPVTMRSKTADLEYVAIDLLNKTGVKMLIIDELHNMLSGRLNIQREFLNLIRYLGNELRIPIVGVGIREAYLAIRSDDQLENRFQPFTLPLWGNDSEFRKLLASFVSIFPLRKPSNIIDEESSNYILRKSEGTIGEIASLLSKAAIFAIDSGKEFIDLSSIEVTDYESPTERRRQFEREVI